VQKKREKSEREREEKERKRERERERQTQIGGRGRSVATKRNIIAAECKRNLLHLLFFPFVYVRIV